MSVLPCAILEQLSVIEETTDSLLCEARQGVLLELSPLQAMIEQLCRALPQQQQAATAALKEEIRIIIQKLDNLTSLLEEQKAALASDIHSTTSGKQAAKAYLKASRK